MATAALISYARRCPYMARNAPVVVSQLADVRQLGEKCPIMGRALAMSNAAVAECAMPDSDPDFSGGPKAMWQEANTSAPVGAQEALHNPPPSQCPSGQWALGTAMQQEEFFDYNGHFEGLIERKRRDHSYRYFNNINRLATRFPYAENSAGQQLTVWCSNDYLGMSRHPVVINAMRDVLDYHGAGSGGTRNISGNGKYHERLEDELADLHRKERALVFTSCYVANDTTLQTLAKLMPGCVIFSDAQNHASMIAGIRNSRAEKHIFKHNDPDDLERILQQCDCRVPKIVAFESVYSMSGTIAPIEKLCDVAHKYGALTFLDEVHAVGMYGSRGAGVAEELGQRVMDKVDIVTGTLGKAYGVIGGYIAGTSGLVDTVRSYGSGFIFTTSLPPAIMAGALASVQYLKTSQVERQGQRDNVAALKERLADVGIPIVDAPSHIVPIQVANARLCKKLSDDLLQKHHIYVQCINYPTVEVGQERLRVTPTPRHHGPLLDYFMDSLCTVWRTNGLPFNPY